MSYGTKNGDVRKGPAGSAGVSLGFTFNWYSNAFTAITISLSNGMFTMSFGGQTKRFAVYSLMTAGSQYQTGQLYYRSTSASRDLSVVNGYINAAYSPSRYSATNAFVITWSNVIDTNGNQYSFQAILTTVVYIFIQFYKVRTY
jgi:hypothetical protein